MNFKIFPAHLYWENGKLQKVPIFSGWKELSTDDPTQIKKWTDEYKSLPMFHWGVACGSVNNFFVLDVDVKPGENGWETLKQNNLQLPETFSQKTQSGGTHLFFKLPVGVTIGNKIKFLPGLDIRGERGYIIWYGQDVSNKPLADAPPWLVEYATKQEKIVSANDAQFRIAPSIAQGTLNECLEAIRNAPPGESNNVLNVKSYEVGQLVAAGAFARDVAEAALFKAAKERGKPDYEAKATIESGLNGGMKNPLTIPFGEPTVMTKVEAPKPPERWTPRAITKEDLLNKSKLKSPQLFVDWSTQDIELITADGGTGKTTLVLYEAVCLALGIPFLGFPCAKPGKTLLITGEDSFEKIAARLGAIMQQMGLFSEEDKVEIVLNSILIKKDADMCIVMKDKTGFLIPNNLAFNSVMQAIEDFKPAMVIFDPLSSFWGSEAALNDMAKAVSKFMGRLVETAKINVKMINHMGKSSSAGKDMSQFAGRGGTGLPSHSRVNRVMRGIDDVEYKELTGKDLLENESAMICNVSKFTDGSPILNKPFVVLRSGFLFTRIPSNKAMQEDLKNETTVHQKIFEWVKEAHRKGKFPSEAVIIAEFSTNGKPLPITQIIRAIKMLEYQGWGGELLRRIDDPKDPNSKDKVFTIINEQTGQEI